MGQGIGREYTLCNAAEDNIVSLPREKMKDGNINIENYRFANISR